MAAAVVRRDYTAGTSAASLSITVAGTGPTYTLTRGSGSYLTDGFKRGDVVRLTAGTFNAANLNKNLLIVTLTATVATVRVLNGTALVAEGPIASATLAVTGKKTFMPTSGHTDRSFTVEHWFSDIAQSEQFLGVHPTQLDIALPPTGIATVNIPVQGQSLVTGTTQYFTSPTAVTSTGLLASVNGIISVGGTVLAAVTGASVSVQSQRVGEPVVGSNVVPQLFEGRMMASGQLSVYFEDATLRNAFVNETEVEVMLALTSNNDANSDFMTVVMPRVKLNTAGKNDGEGGCPPAVALAWPTSSPPSSSRTARPDPRAGRSRLAHLRHLPGPRPPLAGGGRAGQGLFLTSTCESHAREPSSREC